MQECVFARDGTVGVMNSIVFVFVADTKSPQFDRQLFQIKSVRFTRVANRMKRNVDIVIC